MIAGGTSLEIVSHNVAAADVCRVAYVLHIILFNLHLQKTTKQMTHLIVICRNAAYTFTLYTIRQTEGQRYFSLFYTCSILKQQEAL